jgi:hypothetical protein
MREIGRVKLVQIQKRSLKFGERPYRYYDPSPLLVVEALQVTPEGCIGLTEEGEKILDKHHSEHPDSGYSGNNGVSLGFTGHYAMMRREFGEHLVDGCAGENILIDSEKGVYQVSNLGERVWIESAATGERVVLNEIVSAAPCVEFSCYAIDHGRSAYNPEIAKGRIKRTLQFLSDGVRGFYASVEQGKGEGVIRVGDRVYIGDQGEQ